MDYIYIDCDGVILDSEARMLERKEQLGFNNYKSKKDFDNYFKYTQSHKEEWNYIIREANSINDSVEIIRQLQQIKKNIAILTKIHTLDEMKVKADDLRNNRKIYIPIFFVPPGIKKYEIVIPNQQLLIDDSTKNIKQWIEHGGKGLLFDEACQNEDDTRINSLRLLLKR